MTPKEEAYRLLKIFCSINCALLCVNELIRASNKVPDIMYWSEVEIELEMMKQ